ncbi:MAG: hypothetical protein NTY23_11565 [Chloroflexi bacterium]|nr:hypothetical protein [Chloroflexota bacterium]
MSADRLLDRWAGTARGNCSREVYIRVLNDGEIMDYAGLVERRGEDRYVVTQSQVTRRWGAPGMIPPPPLR